MRGGKLCSTASLQEWRCTVQFHCHLRFRLCDLGPSHRQCRSTLHRMSFQSMRGNSAAAVRMALQPQFLPASAQTNDRSSGRPCSLCLARTAQRTRVRAKMDNTHHSNTTPHLVLVQWSNKIPQPMRLTAASPRDPARVTVLQLVQDGVGWEQRPQHEFLHLYCWCFLLSLSHVKIFKDGKICDKTIDAVK